MDCSLPGSSIHGIFQARVQEWGAIAFSVIMCYFLVYSKVMQFYTHTHTHTHMYMYMGFPDSSFGKESTCNEGDPVQFLGWEDLLEKG